MGEKMTGTEHPKKLLPDVGDSASEDPDLREEVINGLEWFNPETRISDDKYSENQGNTKKSSK